MAAQLDLVNRQRPRSHEAEHDADAAGNVTTAILPAPDAPRSDVKQLGNAAVRNAECVERFAEFGPGHAGFRLYAGTLSEIAAPPR